MTEQEFRKLKTSDLIQILLAQSDEVVVQHEDLNGKSKRLESLLEENDIIKTNLNNSDARIESIKNSLNQSDERIRQLEEELKRLYSDQSIELEKTGSLVQAALELNKIFEAAQKEAARYIHNKEKGIKGTHDAAGMTERLGQSESVTEEQPVQEVIAEKQQVERSAAKEQTMEESVAEQLLAEFIMEE